MTDTLPFCDWLDVTYSPEDNPIPSLESFFNQLDFSAQNCFNLQSSAVKWAVGYGLVQMDVTARYARVSASGSALAEIRRLGVYGDYLALLSESPHSVTRLDAALDVHSDGSVEIARLHAQYPEKCKLLRKRVGTSLLLAARTDGRQSGTIYFGNRKSGGVTARVYDKQKERWDRAQQVTGPWYRVEITARKGLSVTLRDAFNPTDLFYHVASPALLTAPSNVQSWHPSEPDSSGWKFEMPEFTAHQVLTNRIHGSADVQALARLALTLGPSSSSRQTFLHLMGQAFDSAERTQDETIPSPTAQAANDR